MERREVDKNDFEVKVERVHRLLGAQDQGALGRGGDNGLEGHRGVEEWTPRVDVLSSRPAFLEPEDAGRRAPVSQCNLPEDHYPKNIV